MHRLPGYSFQHIARLGNPCQVNLGLDLTGQRTRCCLGGTGRSLSRSIRLPAEMLPHLLGLFRLNRAGMSLFLADADLRQKVENFLALDFQFPRQIVDANLFHPGLRPREFSV